MGLENLRTMPRQALSNEHFQVVNPYGIFEGGPVVITQRLHFIRWFHYLYRLEIRPSLLGRDHYVPYLHQAAKSVAVPHPRDGDIVVTDAMNGCALEVTFRDDGYIFYHDSNGNNMHRVTNAGTRVCRIEADAYYDERRMDELGRGVPPRTPVVQFVCVFKGGFWHVGCTGLLMLRNEVVGIFDPRGGKYRGYFNDTTRLLQLDNMLFPGPDLTDIG